MKAVQLLGSAKDGGAETYFLALIEALQAEGVEQACALRPHAARVRRFGTLGVPLLEAPFGGPLDLLTTGRVKRFDRMHVQLRRHVIAQLTGQRGESGRPDERAGQRLPRPHRRGGPPRPAKLDESPCQGHLSRQGRVGQ